MSGFPEAEIEYQSDDHRLGRLATVERVPHAISAGFRYSAGLGSIDIGGHNLGRTKKYRDARSTGGAAFVVDDVLPPWRAEVIGDGGRGVNSGFGGELIRIIPERIVGWGIDSGAFSRNSRSVGERSEASA